MAPREIREPQSTISQFKGRDKHGAQFNRARYQQATSSNDILDYYRDFWDLSRVIPVEPGEVYDNFAKQKEIHQLIDYAGIDYLLDMDGGLIQGVNHREHSPTDSTLRFDLRGDTGTKNLSEVEKMIKVFGGLSISPRFASRLKRGRDGSPEWVRIVDLEPVVGALCNGLSSYDEWDCGGGVTAWMFDYSLLRGMGAVIFESGGNIK